MLPGSRTSHPPPGLGRTRTSLLPVRMAWSLDLIPVARAWTEGRPHIRRPASSYPDPGCHQSSRAGDRAGPAQSSLRFSAVALEDLEHGRLGRFAVNDAGRKRLTCGAGNGSLSTRIGRLCASVAVATVASRWFATEDLEHSSAAGRRAASLVDGALEHLAPTLLDPTRSKVGVDRSETFVALAHRDSKLGDVYIAVYESGWTNLYSPHGYDEVYGSDPTTDQWAADLTESVTTILTGQYRIKLNGWRSPRTLLDYGCSTTN